MGTTKQRRDNARLWLSVVQQHSCAICKRDLRRVKGELDHDHTTGFIRGLLCKSCNVRLRDSELADCLEQSKTSRHEGRGCEICDEAKLWWRKAYIYLRTQELRQKRLISFDCVMY